MLKVRGRLHDNVMLVIFDGAGTLADISDQQTLREGYAYAGSNHPVARPGYAVRGEIVHAAERLARAAQRALDSALVAAAFNQRGKAGLIVDNRDDLRRGIKDLVGVAHQTFGCDDGHLRIYAVFFAFVDGKRREIVARFAGDDAREHRVHRRTCIIFAKQGAKLRVFLLKLFVEDAAQCQLVVLRLELIVFVFDIASQLHAIQITGDILTGLRHETLHRRDDFRQKAFR